MLTFFFGLLVGLALSFCFLRFALPVLMKRKFKKQLNRMMADPWEVVNRASKRRDDL